MFPPTRILLPLDFSERCSGATRYAEALASHFGASIALVHVIEPLRYSVASMEAGMVATGEMAASLRVQAEEQMQAFTCEGLDRLKVTRVLLEGDPAQRIVEYAHDEEASLIVMPTHGYGPFRRLLLGSVTAKVLHDSDCPVFTGVHMEQPPAPPGTEFRRILCAVDLGPQSKKALCWAGQMASAFEARLTLMHAVPRIESRPGEYFDRELAADVSHSAREELEKLNAEMGTGAEVVVEGGDPPKVVCAVAERVGAQLLVIARGSAAGVYGRLRTNAYAIIRGSPCAVVSV